MPLKTAKGLWKRIGVQLTFWYSGIFILSSIGLFGLSYFLLSTSLQKKDRDFILSRMNEYTARYNVVGLEGSIKEIDTESRADGYDAYLVRFADQANKTIYKTVPDDWLGFYIARLDAQPVSIGNQWIKISRSGNKDVVDIFSQKLPDGKILQVGLNTEDRNKVLQKFLGLFTSLFSAVVLIGFIGGSLAALHVLRPIRHIVATARTIIQTGRLEARVPIRQSNDELDDLAILFNQMLEKTEALIKGMRGALDNVAHDLKTPLTRMRNVAESALQAENVHGGCQNALSDCLEESAQVMTMLKALMDISEAETGVLKLNIEKLEVDRLINDVVDLYQHVLEEKNIQLKKFLSKDLAFLGDPTRMRQVFANLLDNAIKYTPVNGYIEFQSHEINGHIHISIKDTGMGIPPRDISKIWDRLYRGDQSRSEQGLGLGLSLVKAIVKSHQGKVDVASEVGVGSCFTLILPVVRSEAQPPVLI